MVILDGASVGQNDLGWESLERFGELLVYERTPADLVLERIGDAECVFVNKVRIDREIFQKSKIRYLGLLSTGFNGIDIVAAREHNVVVSNVPNYSTHVVAQFTFALLLELCHRVSDHNRAVQNGKWIESEDFCFLEHPQIELFGKSLGIIGLGSIGMQVAKIAASFGMDVFVHTRTKKEFLPYTFLSYEELLSKSDVISIHCPLDDATEGMINARSIAKMKDGVLLINTARGTILNEQDVADALDTKKIAGLAVDVLAEEPMNAQCPLRQKENAIITPHIAWLALQTRRRLREAVIDNLDSYLCGNPKNVVS